MSGTDMSHNVPSLGLFHIIRCLLRNLSNHERKARRLAARAMAELHSLLGMLPTLALCDARY
eukprot:1552182-Rhodomonas_salina.7